MSKQVSSTKLKFTILSLSLLTVMAGAAIAPALSAIQNYFSDVDAFFIRMVISLPALFIFITSFIFPKLTKRFTLKTLVMASLIIYLACGLLGAICNNIWLLLILRAGLGIGVGMMMPLSTGLLAFYFPPADQPTLMSLSAAMNNVGGIIATFISGLLATIDWHLSFLVYLMGVIAFLFCIVFLPNDMLKSEKPADGNNKQDTPSLGKVFKAHYALVIAIFLHMTTFYLYPSNFAMETAAAGIMPLHVIPIVMALLSCLGFVGGLMYIKVRRVLYTNIRFMSPIMYIIGYILLGFGNSFITSLLGSLVIGYALGQGMPMIMSEGSARMGKIAAATIMPLLSASLYLGQFLSPVMVSGVYAIMGDIPKLPFLWGIVLGAIYLLWNIRLKLISAQKTK